MNETNGTGCQEHYTANDSALGNSDLSTQERCIETAELVTGESVPVVVPHIFKVLYDDTPRNSDDNRLPPGVV